MYPVELIQKLKFGGEIVSSNDCSYEEIQLARANENLWIDDSNFGYVYRPAKKPIKTIIHVNLNTIKSNNLKARESTEPLGPDDFEAPIKVQVGNKVTYTKEVTFTGTSKVIYRPEDPLACGAKVWIETNGTPIIKECE